VVVETGGECGRSAKNQSALRHALGQSDRIFRRPDGKPVTVNGRTLSAAHARRLTLAVAGQGRVACDVEEVATRADSAWDGLLGTERLRMAERISRERGEDLHTSATRLWNVFECMKKARLPPDAPLVLDSVAPDGWVLFRAGALTIVSCVAAVRGIKAPLAIGLAVEPAAAEPAALADVQRAVTARASERGHSCPPVLDSRGGGQECPRSDTTT